MNDLEIVATCIMWLTIFIFTALVLWLVPTRDLITGDETEKERERKFSKGGY